MLILPGASSALESDQYMTWGRDLRDISSELNTHVNQTIQQALTELNERKETISCAKAHDFAVKKFRGFIVHKIETWLEEELGDDLYPRADMSYQIIFKSVFIIFLIRQWGVFPDGRNLNVNGVILGADKLAHFFSTGLRYFTLFTKAKKGMSDSERTKSHFVRDQLGRSYLGCGASGFFLLVI